ncbi:hypothetical protein E2K93_14630 [Thalassotalea sp. HSM 43]|uniref:hypothetical protein n=1 Tax=Thalassotalea sp. HSM 43 TaxID=2552945 RepID=UPI00108070B2|nr:hypothetical protein [Thalassotalea sp. HSM 43]QBY05530.1 hypothetical protein E2K93_14630 [Thalassotalea sp. HSM 43]
MPEIVVRLRIDDACQRCYDGFINEYNSNAYGTNVFTGKYLREIISLGFGGIITGFFYFLVEYQPFLYVPEYVGFDQPLSYDEYSISLIVAISIAVTVFFLGLARYLYDVKGVKYLLIVMAPTLIHVTIRIDLYTFQVPLTAAVAIPAVLVACIIMLPKSRMP